MASAKNSKKKCILITTAKNRKWKYILPAKIKIGNIHGMMEKCYILGKGYISNLTTAKNSMRMHIKSNTWK